MSRIAETLVPARLGTGFRWLLASSWTTNLGDGIALAAGPLLVASQTRDPVLVSLAVLLQWLPKLLFGLIAGALADRLDRRRLVIGVNLARAVVLAVLTLTLATDLVSVWVVLSALFLLGTAEVLADNTAATLLPMLVAKPDLGLANSRVQAGFITVNQLAGPPMGAALFAAGMVWPFLTQGLLLVLGALLAARLVLPDLGPDPSAPATSLRRDIVEGFAWVVRNPAVRTLVLTIFTFNITYGAAWSVLVLYATERLGMGPVGFGLLTTVAATGGLLGTAAYGWITRHVSLGNLMRVGLVIETVTHLGLALTRTAWVALVIMFVFGAHAFVWGTTSMTIRQRAVPHRLQGRVGSVNMVGVFGGLVIGAAIGGVLARQHGLTAPFWFAFAGSALLVVLIWRQLAHIEHADDSPEPLPAADPGSGEPGR